MPFSRPARRLSLLAAGLLSAGALAACGSSSTSSTAAGSSSGSTAKVPLVLYAAEGYDTAEAKAFQQATGIPVQVDDDSTGPLVTKIKAEKNNPKWSLL